MVRLATLSAVLVVAVVLLLLPAATDARGRVGLRRSQPRNHFSVKQPLSVLSTNPSRSAKEDEGKAAAAGTAAASAAGSKQQKPASSLRARRAAATQPTVASHVVPEPGGFEVFWAANLTGNRPRFVLRGYNTSRPNVYYTLSLSNVNYVASAGITEGIDSIVVADTMDSNQNSVVYALPASNASKAMYLSQDSGQTFNKFVLPFHPVYLEAKPHSSLDLSMLMAPTQMSGIFSLYTYTAKNMGASPVLVSNNVLNASFLSNGTIMYIRLAGNVPILSVYLPDAKKSVDVLKNCDGFLEMGIYLFAETVDPVTHALTLYVSSPTGPTPNTFYVTTFPIQGDIMWFDIVDGGFNTALVVAHHAETKMQGDFFISVGSVNVSTWKADFSPDFNASITTAEFVVFGQDNPGCNADYGWANVKGKIVFVPRGQCKFIEKAQLAEMNGAIAIVIINYNDTTLHMIAPDTDQRPTIPVFAVKYSEGYALTHSVSGAKKAVIYQNNIGKQIVNYHTALYQSDNTGLQYSVSLKDLFDGTDVTRVLSQRNTFLSNFINDDDQVSTLISFNRVASWDYLDKDSDPTNGLHIDVAGDSGVPPPAFSTGAAGIVLANGFRGPGIDYDHPEDSFLHVSLDGGYNWTPANVRDIGPYTAHVINDGTVFVAASAFSDTAVIEFSIDEGNTWATVNLPGVGPDVYFAGMFPEPGVSSMVSYAYLYNTTSGTWIGYTLNFQPMLPTPCNVKTDFTRYTPSDSDGAAGCAMGSSVTYFRRSPSKTCYISSYPAPIYAQCPCKATDYMCAPGYMRSQEIGDDNALLCKRDNSYYPDKCLTTEYLPIPGSSCLLDNFALPYNTCGSSPSTGKKGMSDGAVAAIVLVVLIVVAVLALLAVKYRNKFSGMFAAGGRREVPYGNVQNPHDDDDEDMLTT